MTGLCRHARTGIVTSGDRHGAHAACDVCDRPECVERAIRWASRITGQDARHIPDQPREAT